MKEQKQGGNVGWDFKLWYSAIDVKDNYRLYHPYQLNLRSNMDQTAW